MTKLVLDSVASGYNLTKINNNFDLVEVEFDKVLYRTNPVGTPNSMSNDIDMDGNSVINAGELSAQDVLINGVSITDLIAGIGIAPIAPEEVRMRRFRYEALSDSITQVSLVYPHNGNVNQILVSRNGIVQSPDMYGIIDPNTVLFTTALMTGEVVDFVYFNTVIAAGGDPVFGQLEEIQVVNIGGTTFTLSTFEYEPGTHTMNVYVNGVRMVVNQDYTETNSTEVEFVSPLSPGDELLFVRNEVITNMIDTTLRNPEGADRVGYDGEGFSFTVREALDKRAPNVGKYSDISASFTPSEIDTLEVDGISVLLDGGEGRYYRDPSDVVSASNGGTVLIDTFGNRWKRSSGIVKPKNYTTLVSMPNPTSYPGCFAMFSFVPVYSDGVAWKYVADNSLVV